MPTEVGVGRRSIYLKGVAAAVALLMGVFGAAACGSDDGDKAGVVVERPGKFRVELPAGWRVILPEPNVHEDRVPLFSAFPQAGEEETGVILFLERGPSLEAKAKELADSNRVLWGDFERESDGQREMMIAEGAGTSLRTGKSQETILAVMRSPNRPDELWAFSCIAPDLAKSPCEKLVRGFTLLP